MKSERWYDIKCDICSKRLSSDYKMGMQCSRESAIKLAKAIGYKDTILGTACPICRRDVFHENVDCSEWEVSYEEALKYQKLADEIMNNTDKT